ncbi:MAG TPA: helix-turn-helix domain-containing protein [Gemmatimonadaceae bacterium]|nr:helix-turn-helix domain-containing protein [Gemmatimonadaceae bacterium]
MYERAAVKDDLDALWHVDEGLTFFAGPLDYNASHQHGAPVFLAGLYESFRLRLDGRNWISCHSAVIPAGVRHELELGGKPLAVFYVEPATAGIESLTPLVHNTAEVDGVLVGTTREISFLRSLYEDRTSTRYAGAALGSLLDFSTKRARKRIDPRITHAIAALGEGSDDLLSASHAATAAGLSASRFQHLFTREVGVPFRRYRAWQRMRHAIREIVHGGTFTTAAHTAGFFDQAHFAHDFRRTFGAPASRSLSRVR